MYYKGQGVPKNNAEAVKWFRLYGKQGGPKYQYILGVLYASGRDVPQDYNEAVRWYRIAAIRGYAPAQASLGFMYETGQGIQQDYVKVAKWYRKAAEQGNVIAQSNLGGMYEFGQGVPQNDAQAYAWYNLATAQGYKDARWLRDRIRNKMPSTQVAEAQKLSRTLTHQLAQKSSSISPSPAITAAPKSSPQAVIPSRNTVFRVQQYLAALGYNFGPIDGVLGGRTINSVKAFQRNRPFQDVIVNTAQRVVGRFTMLDYSSFSPPA